MIKTAFVDLSFHKKTKSSVFFLEFIKNKFDVDIYYENEVKEYIKQNYEKYIFWQAIPDFLDLMKIKDKDIILIPMYDGLPLYKLAWERYKCFKIKIVCFCKKVYDFFSNMGFECFYIQYFMEPLKYNVNYKKKNIFFWYRGNITRKNVKTIIGDQKVSITIKNNPDPGYEKLELSDDDINKYNITFLDKFFDTKEEYFKHLAKHSIFIAPRKQEGIGMSFLESMSIGQCVIAYDDATMNEYITNNKNGILTKFNEKINLDNYETLGRKAILNYAEGLNKRNDNIDLCISFINKNRSSSYKKISIIDYVIDTLIKARRALIKFYNYFR